MKKRSQLQSPAIRKETLHKILYVLMMQKAVNRKLQKPVAELVAAEN